MDIEPIGTDAGGYTYRPYEPGDEEAIVDLHNAVWDGGRTLAWFRWKYVETPAVEHVPVFVAEHEGEIVGALGLAAYRMWGDGEVGLGVLGSDLVVAESHRRRGIFTSLYRDGTGRYRRGAGVPDAECPDFFFGYANPSSHPGMRKLGTVDVEPRRPGAGVCGPVESDDSQRRHLAVGRTAKRRPETCAVRIGAEDATGLVAESRLTAGRRDAVLERADVDGPGPAAGTGLIDAYLQRGGLHLEVAVVQGELCRAEPVSLP